MSQVKLITITPGAERLICYLARVSSSNQDNPEYSKLIKYLIDHAHWSPFELVHAVIEINTTRAISAQILRHRSFSFSEFSQRYAQVQKEPVRAVGRKQAEKNRQSSAEPLDAPEEYEWQAIQDNLFDQSIVAYSRALEIGVAREQARMLLPLATPTRLYMGGTLRSWLHFCTLRCEADTQLEHRQLAEQCRSLLAVELPVVAEALGWTA